jgi:hypothetical protein
LPFIISVEPSAEFQQGASHMTEKIQATATATATASSRRAVASSLELDLAAGGLQHAAALSGILHELGMLSMQDIRLLNSPEQLELVESLRDAGISLGLRSKLRRLSAVSGKAHDTLGDCRRTASADGNPLLGTVQDSSVRDVRGGLPAKAPASVQMEIARRALQKDDEGLSADSIAIVVTAVYILKFAPQHDTPLFRSPRWRRRLCRSSA